VGTLALLTIGGVVIPSPSEHTVGIQDISNAQRNANGTMIIERITTKKTIKVSYAYISASDLKTVLAAIAPAYYNVTFLDPSVDAFVTSSFYCGDRSIGMINYQDGVAMYKDFSFDLIER
jgi:hypothetical protein